MLNQGVSTQVDIIPAPRRAPAEAPAPEHERDDAYKHALGRELRRGAPADNQDDSRVEADPQERNQDAPVEDAPRTRPHKRDETHESRTPHEASLPQTDSVTSNDGVLAPDAESDEDALQNVLAPIENGAVSVTELITSEPVQPIVETDALPRDHDVHQDTSFAPELSGELQVASAGQNQDGTRTTSVNDDQLQSASLNDVRQASSIDGPPTSLNIRIPNNSAGSDQATAQITNAAVTVTDSVVPIPPQNLQLDGGVRKDDKAKAARATTESSGNAIQGPESFFQSPTNQSGVGTASVNVPGVTSPSRHNDASVRTPVPSGEDAPVLPTTGAVDGDAASARASSPNPSFAPTHAVEPTSRQDGFDRTALVGSSTGIRAEPRVDQSQIVERVTQLVQSAQESGRVLRARLHPPELGALQVEVRQGQNGAVARLTIETSAAQQVLNDHLQQLHETLSQSGPIDRIEIQLTETQDSPDSRDAGRHDGGAFSDQDANFEDSPRERRSFKDRDDEISQSEEQQELTEKQTSSLGIDLSELDVAV